jgi:hypothetical protein
MKRFVLNAFHLVFAAFILGACAAVAPVPTTVDTSVPAVVEAQGLRARLDVLERGETDVLFGGNAGTRIGVLVLKVENHGTIPCVAEAGVNPSPYAGSRRHRCHEPSSRGET